MSAMARRRRPLVDSLTVAAGLRGRAWRRRSATTSRRRPTSGPRPIGGRSPPAGAAAARGGRALAAPRRCPRGAGPRGCRTPAWCRRRQGVALQPALAPGQRLVSREGDLWRWDGFTSAADAPTAAARRLGERNRLGGLNEAVEAARAAAEQCRLARDAAREAAAHAAGDERQHRDAWRDAGRALEEARRAARHERETAEMLLAERPRRGAGASARSKRIAEAGAGRRRGRARRSREAPDLRDLQTASEPPRQGRARSRRCGDAPRPCTTGSSARPRQRAAGWPRSTPTGRMARARRRRREADRRAGRAARGRAGEPPWRSAATRSTSAATRCWTSSARPRRLRGERSRRPRPTAETGCAPAIAKCARPGAAAAAPRGPGPPRRPPRGAPSAKRRR